MTRHRFICSVVLVLGLALVGAAQGPSLLADEGKTITVKGCLRHDAATNTYTLTGIHQASKTIWTTYQLTPAGDVDLSRHVGHRVLVTGKLVRELARTDGTTASEPTGTKPTIEVRKLDHVSKKCR